MKITKFQLKQIIKEELEDVLSERGRRGPVTPAEQWIVYRGSQRVPKAVQADWHRRGVRIGYSSAPSPGDSCYDDLTKCYQRNELGQFERIGQEEEPPIDA
jgi:hypothetical protein